MVDDSPVLMFCFTFPLSQEFCAKGKKKVILNRERKRWGESERRFLLQYPPLLWSFMMYGINERSCCGFCLFLSPPRPSLALPIQQFKESSADAATTQSPPQERCIPPTHRSSRHTHTHIHTHLAVFFIVYNFYTSFLLYCRFVVFISCCLLGAPITRVIHFTLSVLRLQT